MKLDWYSKLMLTLIAASLTAMAAQPALTPLAARALSGEESLADEVSNALRDVNRTLESMNRTLDRINSSGLKVRVEEANVKVGQAFVDRPFSVKIENQPPSR